MRVVEDRGLRGMSVMSVLGGFLAVEGIEDEDSRAPLCVYTCISSVVRRTHQSSLWFETALFRLTIFFMSARIL